MQSLLPAVPPLNTNQLSFSEPLHILNTHENLCKKLIPIHRRLGIEGLDNDKNKKVGRLFELWHEIVF